MTRVIVLWLILILTGVIMAKDKMDSAKKLFQIEDVASFSVLNYFPRGVEWLPEAGMLSLLEREDQQAPWQLYLVDARNGSRSRLLSGPDLLIPGRDPEKRFQLSDYFWLPGQAALVALEEGDIWQYRFAEKSWRQLTRTGNNSELAASPDFRYLSFVRENDLYVYDLTQNTIQRLSEGGSETILNGKLDWLYQEELVGRGKFKAYFWSPNSEKIAYLQFDQSQVPRYPLVDWSAVHPGVEWMRYPKAGDPNSRVKLAVVDLASRQTTWIDPGEQQDFYIPRVYWLPSGEELAFMALDRRQQNLEFRFADISSGNSRVVLSESDPHWINIGDYVHFYKDQEAFLWASERSGYNHLYLYDYKGKLLSTITSGEWYVDQLEGVDETNDWIYFTSTEKDLRERHLYRVHRSGKGKTRLTRADGAHRIEMGRRSEFYLDQFSSTVLPFQATLHQSDGKQTAMLVEPDQTYSEEYAYSAPELFEFTGANGLTYYASMIKPPDFDPGQEYPVLIYTYGGPHAQVVRNDFPRLWHALLAQKGYIVFKMDNRGAAGRGHAWETPIYQQMGRYELEDQLEGVNYLKSLSYVDSERLGIWGWSYGGYMTLYALTHSKVFKTGISVAPVTDWRYYDTAYTERYMGLPSENPDGYRDSAPRNAAADLHGKLLLVHGSGDDNVHFQQTVQMADALIEAGKQFRMMVYPNQKHGIAARKDRRHLYQMMTDFILENL